MIAAPIVNDVKFGTNLSTIPSKTSPTVKLFAPGIIFIINGMTNGTVKAPSAIAPFLIIFNTLNIFPPFSMRPI